jgi:hypothetical protein
MNAYEATARKSADLMHGAQQNQAVIAADIQRGFLENRLLHAAGAQMHFGQQGVEQIETAGTVH